MPMTTTWHKHRLAWNFVGNAEIATGFLNRDPHAAQLCVLFYPASSIEMVGNSVWWKRVTKIYVRISTTRIQWEDYAAGNMSPRFLYYLRDASVFDEMEVFVGIESLQELAWDVTIAISPTSKAWLLVFYVKIIVEPVSRDIENCVFSLPAADSDGQEEGRVRCWLSKLHSLKEHMSYLNPSFWRQPDSWFPYTWSNRGNIWLLSYHANKRAPFINVCYRCSTYSVFSLVAAGKTLKRSTSIKIQIHHLPEALQSKFNFTVGKKTHIARYISNHLSFPVDRLNGLAVGSTIVVENTTSKQHLHRTTTNKGKKLKSGNIIVWEANLRQWVF